MQVVVPAAGRGFRFVEQGFREPKPLISGLGSRKPCSTKRKPRPAAGTTTCIMPSILNYNQYKYHQPPKSANPARFYHTQLPPGDARLLLPDQAICNALAS